MFSVVSVCLFTRGEESYVTITRSALDLTVQWLLPPPTDLATAPSSYGTSLHREPALPASDIW